MREPDPSPGDLEVLAGLVQIDLSTGHAKEAVARIEDRLKEAQPSVGLLILAARAMLPRATTTASRRCFARR